MPENVGPYRIVRRIATGGMAEVYLARQQGIEGLERAVVLKRIHGQYANDEEFVTMFLDEARLMAALSHPNIAQVFDLGRVGDSYYLVMEYIRGPTLDALLRANELRGGGHALPLPAALPIVMQVAEALAYLHDVRDEFGRPLHVVHRDLNPLNVIVGYNGSVKLIDFGIAKTAVKVYETRQGVVKGTYGYISPEQLTAKGNVDFRADLFALGVLFYELCLGELPFGPGEAPDLLDRIRHARYTRPQKINPTFPPRLEALIAKCLAADPAARPTSMHAFIEELAAYMSVTGVLPTLGRVAETVQAILPEPNGAAPLVIRRVSKRPVRDYVEDEDTIIAALPAGLVAADGDFNAEESGTARVFLRSLGSDDDERTDATVRKLDLAPRAAPPRAQPPPPSHVSAPPSSVRPSTGPASLMPTGRTRTAYAAALLIAVAAGIAWWLLQGR